jgi:hypothetical protein
MEITKDSCYLIGTCFGDASAKIYKYTYDKSFFGLNTVDLDFAEKFQKCLENVFSIKTKISIYKSNYKDHTYYRVCTQRKGIVNQIMEYIKEDFILSLPIEFKLEILRAVFDSEGCVSLYYRKPKNKPNKYYSLLIRFSTNYFENIFEQLLNDFNIKFNKHKHSTNGNISFNIWCNQAIKFYNLLKPFTIKRKDKTAKEYINLKYSLN